MSTKSFFLISLWVVYTGCGVKGDPLPPLAPSASPQPTPQIEQVPKTEETTPTKKKQLKASGKVK